MHVLSVRFHTPAHQVVFSYTCCGHDAAQQIVPSTHVADTGLEGGGGGGGGLKRVMLTIWVIKISPCPHTTEQQPPHCVVGLRVPHAQPLVIVHCQADMIPGLAGDERLLQLLSEAGVTVGQLHQLLELPNCSKLIRQVNEAVCIVQLWCTGQCRNMTTRQRPKSLPCMHLITRRMLLMHPGAKLCPILQTWHNRCACVMPVQSIQSHCSQC